VRSAAWFCAMKAAWTLETSKRRQRWQALGVDEKN
jgi:hypothetical protein